MQMHYATEVRSLSVNLPSQYGYLNKRNFHSYVAAQQEKNIIECR